MKFLRIILILKLLVIVGFLAKEKNWIQFGEKFLTAAEGDEVEEDYFDEEAESKPKRKSYLDELFDLPEIAPKGLEREEIGRYMTLLRRKRQQVADRLKMLQDRETRLIDLEKVLDQKLVALDNEKKYFLSTIQREKELKEERLKQLLEFYKKMAPKKAAPVFEKLNKDLVIALFDQLPEKQITAILSAMNAERSVELTEYYGRVRSGREYEVLKEMNSSLKKEFDEKCRQ